ncbi:unnamed protein product [Phytophthora fragariaefolia]|uniref:Unnamed protein product n=1 Tax=Phytophthora fragariaefolia TaxID=1490495 RepID=A0A9W6X6S5_9STRA|nr:unnamed protein product [Phytophthora fragariaefolia]
MKRRQSSRVRKLDALGAADKKLRLRQKLWKDLSRFGLWPMAGPGDVDDQQSVESAVDAIWTQWQDNAAGSLESTDDRGSSNESMGFSIGDGVILDDTDASSVFLTGVPSTSSSTTTTGSVSEEEADRRRSSVVTNSSMVLDGPEDDDNNNDEEDGFAHFGFSASRLQATVQTPGLKRRKRLADLHHFVSTQLQKRLFKSWDTIEIAFSGSGDMTVSQIVKFLQHSDVQLGDKDAAKVQQILEEHVATMQAAQDVEMTEDGADHTSTNQRRGKAKAVLSYEGFRQIFHPVDPQEASKWKREFDREKFRKRQEKEIYSKELAALEEKVRQRLANSAKQMVEILQQFRCNPNTIPWEDEQHRLQLRSQFFEVIFRKPHRRRILHLDNRFPQSDLMDTSGVQSASSHPNKLSVKLVLSTLLQKYSRNGHFESIEVPVAAYLYHDFAADIMKQSVRRYWGKIEIDQWPERQMIFRFRMKKQVFQDWRVFADRARMLRRYVLRKFVAWKNHGHMLQQLHKFYMVRVTFYILRYYSILKRDMKRRKYKSFLAQFSATSRAKSQPHHQRQHGAQQFGGNTYDRGAQQRASLHLTDHEQEKAPTNRRSFQAPEYEAPQNGRMSPLDSRSTRGSIRTSSLLVTDEGDYNMDVVRRGHQSGDSHDEVSDANAATSLTRIMETELGKKIKRKSRLYDLCLGLYLKYRELDRSNMIGNVVAYRRFGRIFFKYMSTLVRRNKQNRLATDLGSYRVLSTRFRQWMIGTVYKVPPTAQDDDTEPSRNDDESEQVGDKAVLHWREDREWRLQAIANNPIQAQMLREDLLSIMENDSVRKETIRGRELLLNKKQQNEDAFLRKETGVTLKMKAAQMQQVQQIIRRRAHRLHDAMDNVYDVLLQQQARQQLKSSFRSLRIVVMMKYTNLLCHRAQIRNWLRLCYRFVYWEKHMDTFYKLKLKYQAFRTLLKHAAWKWKFQSQGLSLKLQRSQELMWKHEHFMEEKGMFNGSSESLRLAATKFSPAASFRGTFLRWIQFTQCSKARQEIIRIVRRKQEIWSMHNVFFALKNRVKAKYTYEKRCSILPYLWRQCMVDLDTYHCKILALQQCLPTTRLKAQLHESRQYMRQTAMSAPTLKKLFQAHEKEVRQRLQLEKRLMLVAYNDRAVHKYAERSSCLFGTATGRPFTHDKVPPFGSIVEVAIICGKKVDGIAVVIKAHGHVSSEGILHGNPFGTREVFCLARGEKLITVEGFASHSIYGLRFGTSAGRFSKWFGHCEKGSKFEVHSDYLTNREEIIGFFGHADSASVNSLGVVMRHTTIKNPFEGMWVQKDLHTQHILQHRSPDELSLCDRQFAYFLQVRACEVLLAMERAHSFAVRAYRIEESLPPALGNMRIIMALARWMLNAFSHGLVQCTEREEEGKQILQRGQDKYAVGEKLLMEGTSAMQIVDSFRDSAGQLDAATLGVKKIVELREMMSQAQQQITQGEQLRGEGQHDIMVSQRILPHLSTSRRMIAAIRKMYKIVQTKDEIDQMNPELRSAKFVAEDLSSLDGDANWWHQRVRLVEHWLRDETSRVIIPDDGTEEVCCKHRTYFVVFADLGLLLQMIRRHIQRGDSYPRAQCKCWKHIVMELRDLPCFSGIVAQTKTHDVTSRAGCTASPNRGKLRPGKDLIVLSDEKCGDNNSNPSTQSDDNESNNVSSSWSLEPLNPETEPPEVVKKPRPLSSATYLSRRELGIDAITVGSIGKSFSGMSLLERQMEWLRKKHDKMEAERMRQAEESERELTFRPKLIRRITYSGDRHFRDTSVESANGRSFTRSESSRRVGESGGGLLKEKTLPKVPRLSHHRRPKKKTPLQSAAISQPVGVSCKLLDSMKSELQASLATSRVSETGIALAEESSRPENQQEEEPTHTSEGSASSSDNSDGNGEDSHVPETEAPTLTDEVKAPTNAPAWSAKPTIGGRRVDFDSSETKVRLTLQDASKFELSTMYRKTDRRAGRDGVALHVGRREDTLEEQVIAVLFDREKVTEEEAERWWSSHQHRFAEFMEPPPQAREEDVHVHVVPAAAVVVLPVSSATTQKGPLVKPVN